MIIDLPYFLATALVANEGDLRGPITGGTPVSVVGGAGYVDESLDDEFPGAVVDPGKWTASAVGSGVVSQNDGLFMRTGAAVSSSAVLTSVGTFGPIGQVEFRFSVEVASVAEPAGAVRYLDVELYVSATRYFRVSRVYDPALPVSARHSLQVTCVVGGVAVDSATIPLQAMAGTVLLTRVRNRVIVEVGGNRLLDSSAFGTEAASLIFRAVNPSATYPYDFTTELNDFRVPTVVLFGDEPGHVDSLEESSVRATTPSVRTPRVVDVSIWTAAGEFVRVTRAFEYTVDSEFLAARQSSVTVGVLSDPTLRNRVPGNAGFLS